MTKEEWLQQAEKMREFLDEWYEHNKYATIEERLIRLEHATSSHIVNTIELIESLFNDAT